MKFEPTVHSNIFPCIFGQSRHVTKSDNRPRAATVNLGDNWPFSGAGCHSACRAATNWLGKRKKTPKKDHTKNPAQHALCYSCFCNSHKWTNLKEKNKQNASTTQTEHSPKSTNYPPTPARCDLTEAERTGLFELLTSPLFCGGLDREPAHDRATSGLDMADYPKSKGASLARLAAAGISGSQHFPGDAGRLWPLITAFASITNSPRPLR